MKRVVVIGPPGSGTTTFADRLGDRLDAAVVDLDALSGPASQPTSTPELRSSVIDAISPLPRWIVVGNHVQVADITHRAADTIVWLDLDRRHTVARVARRSLGHLVRRRPLGNAPGQRWRDVVHPRRSVVVAAWRTHPRHRAKFEELSATPLWRDTEVHRLRHPGEVESFLDSVADTASSR